MIHMLHKSLIMLLVLLQLVAPLVHAHSEQDESPEGIHLPGLEFVTGHDKGVVFSTTTSHTDYDGTIISVSSGIQYKNFSRASVEKVYLLTKNTQHNTANCLLELSCLLEGLIIQHKIFLQSGSPRAPPT